jgi:hypothetical protein
MPPGGASPGKNFPESGNPERKNSLREKLAGDLAGAFPDQSL